MDSAICELCGKAIPVPSSYIVRIDIFADPSMPTTTSDELAATDFDEAIARLLDEMRDLSADELQDQVYRRFEFRLCVGCQPKLLANPLGKPRDLREW